MTVFYFTPRRLPGLPYTTSVDAAIMWGVMCSQEEKPIR
jgi:hypothetical protein